MARKDQSNGKKRNKARKVKHHTRFELTQRRLPDLAPWIARGMLDDEEAPLSWRTCPAMDERTQVCVLHRTSAYASRATPEDDEELMLALARTQHELGDDAVTFHHAAVSAEWAGIMYDADQPALVANVIALYWGLALRKKHDLGDPFARELRWSLPGEPSEMEVIIGLMNLDSPHDPVHLAA